jgi:hypothetical protein
MPRSWVDPCWLLVYSTNFQRIMNESNVGITINIYQLLGLFKIDDQQLALIMHVTFLLVHKDTTH